MLIINNVFTGGFSSNEHGIIRQENKANYQRPLPKGPYNIVEHVGNTDPNHADWYRLDAQDDSPI